MRVRVRNTVNATFTDVTTTIANPPYPAVTDAQPTLSWVNPLGTALSDDTITLRIPQRRLPDAARWIQSQGFEHAWSGWEIPTLAREVVFIDAASDAAFIEPLYLVDLRRGLVFDDSAPILSEVTVGSIVLPTPDYEHWPELDPAESPNFPSDIYVCRSHAPLRINETVAGGGAYGGQVGQNLLPGEIPGGEANWGLSLNAHRFDEAVETEAGVILAAGDRDGVYSAPPELVAFGQAPCTHRPPSDRSALMPTFAPHPKWTAARDDAPPAEAADRLARALDPLHLPAGDGPRTA